MRRRRGFRRATVAAPFGSNDMACLRDACDRLFRRAQQMHPVPEITHDQFSELFIQPEHREAFKIAAMWAKQSRYNREDTIIYNWPLPVAGEVALTFKLHGSVNTLVPNEPKLQPGAPAEVVQAITDWAETRLTLGLDWGRVAAVLNKMNEVCRTNTQVRYLWPSILSLAKVANIENSAKIEEYKEPSRIPALEPGLRAALQKTAGTIAMAVLLGDPVTVNYDGRVALSCNQSRRIEEDGLGSYATF